MTRPTQEPACRIYDKKTHEPIDVLTHEVMFTITYDGKLMNTRQSNVLKSGDIYKRYTYTLVSCKGDAENKCRKLNERFKTDKFAVKEIRI